jgi:hypothetical protein
MESGDGVSRSEGDLGNGDIFSAVQGDQGPSIYTANVAQNISVMILMKERKGDSHFPQWGLRRW